MEWCRILVAEVAPPGQHQGRAMVVLEGNDAPARGVMEGRKATAGSTCARCNRGLNEATRVQEAAFLEIHGWHARLRRVRESV